MWSEKRSGRDQSGKNQLEVDEGSLTVHYSRHLPKTAATVETATTGRSVVRIKANGVSRPRFRQGDRLVEQAPTDAASLQAGVHGHIREIKRPLYDLEVRCVDCPGLLGREAEDANDCWAVPSEKDNAMLEPVQNAALRNGR